jgi:hypothetical protein
MNMMVKYAVESECEFVVPEMKSIVDRSRLARVVVSVTLPARPNIFGPICGGPMLRPF